ncbi:MAG: hypothetical protein JSW02_08905 [candidate division WOR-3 bacterium]|nr:MAG: hypothetical protein JSW02_08905 [candidate division WOR-3 bacterium]
MKEQDDIILETFSRWAKSQNPVQSRVSVFEHIRDIPYALIPELIDPITGPQEMLVRNEGSCSPKHFLLGTMLTMLNIPVQYATYPFLWHDLKLHYPDQLRTLVQNMPVEYHVACKAYIDNKWVLVDATWDRALKSGGFVVNEDWDGESDTFNAVNPLNEILHKNVRKRMDYVQSKTAYMSDECKEVQYEFYREFSRWLAALR